MWKTEKEMFGIIKDKLSTPIVVDVLDEMGYYHQTLPAKIKSMKEDMKLAGKAMTVLMIDVFEPQDKPFGYLTEALDQLEEDEIYIATGGSQRCAYWGEILTATARVRGATGAVVNGWHRDTNEILEQNWPVFSMGSWAQDSSVRTKVVDFRCRIEVEGVIIDSGDIVFGDIDGVLVIPKDIIKEVIEKSLDKASKEKLARKAIESGMSSTDVFKKYGIL